MVELLSKLGMFLDTISRGNQLIAGIIGVWGLGVATLLAKGIPSKIFSFVKKHLTTSVVISNVHISFFRLMTFFSQASVVDRVRKLRFYNGRWGGSDEITKGIGEGKHVVWFEHIPMLLSLEKEQTYQHEERLVITLTKLGRSHRVFDKLKAVLEEEINDYDPKKTKIWNYADGWDEVMSIPIRSLESVILQKQKKDMLLSCVRSFLDKESWYREYGIPYQLGILFYGFPGTGKTSLIKALASYMQYGIATLSASHLSSLQKAISSLPKRTVLVIEDIDASQTIRPREKSKEKKPKPEDESKSISPLEEAFFGTSLSEVLNSLDGLLSLHGRIMIFTTNHVEKIDSALLRPGRIDLKIEVGYTDIEMFFLFLERFFKDSRIHKDEYKGKVVKTGITIADLQNDILMGRDLQWFLEKYLEE